MGHLYQNQPEVIGASVTWSASVDGDDVSSLWGESNGTYRFRGIEYVSNVTSPQSGDVILLPTGGFRHRGATRFAHLSNPEGWIGGPYADEDEANNHVTALNDVSAYANALQLVTAYTAGTTHYQWVNIIEEVPAVHALTDAEVGDSTSDVTGTISGEQLDDFAPELGIAEATSKVSDEFGRVSGRRIGEAIDAHVVPSTNATTDISTASAIGTSLELSRDDHEHELPIDNTLEFNASDELSVNVQDVIEHLQERIQYHTSSSNYSSSAGATVGQAYATSAYRKTITKVEVLLNPLVGADGYLVRLDELNADNSIKAKLFTSQTRSAPFGLGVTARAFNFHNADGDVGVNIDGSIRLGILISRIGDNSDSAVAAVHGTEASSSPRESYDDASTDFDLENDVVYQHIDPAIGASTHSHGTDIRGNIKIFYELIIDHGNLVGDGQVNAAHIDSGSAPDGDVLTADGSSGATWETPTGGGGGGGTDDQTAAEVTVDTTNFSRNLTSADDSVQDALETIDGFTQYQGAWQQASWPAGVIVTRSGVAYISLVNSNTEIPTPFSENWSALVEGLAYRGEAPVLATSYSYGQVVLNPDNDNYYFYTSTISASVARADIATHANFHGIVIQATEANKGGVRGSPRRGKRLQPAARRFSAGRTTASASLFPRLSPP